MGRTAGEAVRISEVDPPAGAGRQWRQRRDHLFGELSILQRHLPNAQLILYPDANHGSQYQYPKRFVQHVSLFLSEAEAR
jgi:pimeloyl-ACP methyl ester carboxylesterase